MDLQQRLCLRILRLTKLLDLTIVLLDLECHLCDLLDDWSKCLSQPGWHQGQALRGKGARRRRRHAMTAGLRQPTHPVTAAVRKSSITLHALHAHHDLRLSLLVANSSDVRDSFCLHRHHHRGLCRTSEGGEQSGLRDHHFVRNVGGSIFIAITGAIVTNRSLFHQARQQESMQPGNPAFVNQVNALTSYFGGSGKGPGPGLMARAAIYQQLDQQAAAQAYQDIYRLFSWMAMGMVVCAFILSKNKPGQGTSAGEGMH